MYYERTSEIVDGKPSNPPRPWHIILWRNPWSLGNQQFIGYYVTDWYILPTLVVGTILSALWSYLLLGSDVVGVPLGLSLSGLILLDLAAISRIIFKARGK